MFIDFLMFALKRRLYEPRCEKTGLRGFRPGPTQTGLYSHRGWLEACNFTVGKHIPCKLSFVYTSYIRYGVRAAPKFGKHTSLVSYYKGEKYV